MSFQRAVAFILSEEKGLVDDPLDPGGVTKYGIALRRHPELTRQQILDMTPLGAANIFHGPQYWGAVHGDELPDAWQLIMLDAAVLDGSENAIKWLQRALFIKDDGKMGPVTIRTAAANASLGAVRRFGAERLFELSSLKGWPHDGKGWAGRVIAATVAAFS